VKIFLGILSSSILSRWPNQLILCPFIHFTIFLLISSIRYNSRRDGIYVNTKITAGAIVNIISIICHSRMNRPVCLFWIILIIVYNTVVMIINIIISAWSWKKINCSMTGDALSCSVRFNPVVIVSNESFNNNNNNNNKHLSTLSHKRHDFRKKLLNTKCVLIFSTAFV
jgi:hypothetical protein